MSMLSSKLASAALASRLGKTSATLVFFKEYLRIVDRVHLVSGTLSIDPKYVEMSRLVREKYKSEGIDLDDPEERGLHREHALREH